MNVLIPGFFGAMLGTVCILFIVWMFHDKIHAYLQNHYCKHDWEDLNEITDDEGVKRALAQQCKHCNIKRTQPLIPKSTSDCVKDHHHWQVIETKKIIRGESTIGTIFYLQCKDCGEITSRKEEI